MEQVRYQEMIENYRSFRESFCKKRIVLFGHCEATLTLADTLLNDGFKPVAILDNNPEKYGLDYKGIPVLPPDRIMDHPTDETAVLIVIRFYEAMNRQLRKIGFKGDVYKLVDYNTFAEYSFSEDTINRKRDRLEKGRADLKRIKNDHPGKFAVFCPFNALGDVYFCLSYLPYYLKRRNVEDYLLCVPSNGCRKVAELFGVETIIVMPQNELDAVIQAVIYEEDNYSFIAHQDRPYVLNLHKALKVRRIPLETMYCCGVFGLDPETVPIEPVCWTARDGLGSLVKGKTVVLSPYAKSVVALPGYIWEEIVADYTKKGYCLLTNVSGDEKPLPGTEPLYAELAEMKSILEYAGTFIGIRSGLCDVIRTVKCRKMALYPDYNYGDTEWKAIEMYSIEGFDNIVV